MTDKEKIKKVIEKTKEETEEHLHYLKVLRANNCIYQPEIRYAIEFAINLIEQGLEAINKDVKKYD